MIKGVGMIKGIEMIRLKKNEIDYEC